MKNKVFCIGFHKTGTTSLAIALRELGYRVTGPDGVNDPDIESNALSMAFKLAEENDAFQDNPWPIIYKDLDERYPGSKFILLLRDTDAWIRSQVKHFGKVNTPMRKWIYGVGHPEGNEDIYIRRYEQHNKEVLAYFEDRPKDLLIMNLAKGDGWEELCSFLETDTPESPFPRANTAIERESQPRPNVLRRIIEKANRLARGINR